MDPHDPAAKPLGHIELQDRHRRDHIKCGSTAGSRRAARSRLRSLFDSLRGTFIIPTAFMRINFLFHTISYGANTPEFWKSSRMRPPMY